MPCLVAHGTMPSRLLRGVGCLALVAVLASVASRAETAPASPVAGAAAVAPAPVATDGNVLNLTLRAAVLASLENNRALEVRRHQPEIQRTYEDEERAVFDPVLSATGGAARQRLQRPAAGGVLQTQVSDALDGTVAVATFLPSGTTLGAQVGVNATESSLYNDPFVTVDVGVSVTQALWRGAGARVNLARLHQARISTDMSAFEFRGVVEALVADVERTYWDLALAEKRIAIYRESLALAEQQLQETRDRIAVGRLAETELAAAEAEVAARREVLITARGNYRSVRLRLLRLMNLPETSPAACTIALADRPVPPARSADAVDDHVTLALTRRPDLAQARLDLDRQELSVVLTRNGLLPRLDVFIALGKSGYASSFADSAARLDERQYDVSAGMILEMPFANRRAEAQHRRATLTRDQAEAAVENMAQLVVFDVHQAHIEVERFAEQVTASAATRRFREETLRAETEKFRVGKSTSFQVAQAQRDLVISQLTEVQAVSGQLQALVDLFLLEGSLLERRGFEVPAPPRAVGRH